MILTLLRIGFINLRRDRVAQALTFLLPIIFFSIFATVFGSQRNPTSQVSVAVVDEDGSAYSQAIVQALQRQGGLHVVTTKGDSAAAARLTRADALAMVKAGTLLVAAVLPAGLGASPALWAGGSSASRPAVQVLSDISDPVAPQMVVGLLQEVGFTAMPSLLAKDGIETFQKYAGGLTPEQRRATDQWLHDLDERTRAGAAPAASANIGLPVHVVDVMQAAGGNLDTISFYAAGVGVMFLLFSSSSGGGTLLEEQESGTLGRLLGSRAGMNGVLTGKWLYLTLVGMLQLTVMFVWGAVVFKLPLAAHVVGFVLMTAFTAAAAAGFGLVLATVSRSRQQLSAMSTILILSMSAVGGSMFPRFLMSATMQKIGLVTFNAWALDGYLKVFWRSAALWNLWPQIAVLTGLTVVFLGLSRQFARRWEAL